MKLATHRNRLALAAVATAAAGAMTLSTAPTASAAPIWTLHYSAKISSVVKKPGKTVTFTGTQVSTVDLGATSNNVSAAIKLGNGTMPVDLPVIPGLLSIPGLATATLAIEPVGPAKGNFNSGNIDVTQYFNIRIVKLTPAGLPFVNLAPSTCKTSTTTSMHLTGKITGLFDPFTATGSYTIPNFSGCGLLGPVINQLTAGPGNSVKATFTPTA